MKGISPIKVDKTIKEAFTAVEMEQLRRAADNERDLAIVELLYATGMRVSEMEALNRSDIDFINKVVKVYGKGGKERHVYINSTAAYYLEMYLKTRKDSEFALFVGSRSPYKRLEVSAIQRMLRELGKKAGVEKVHPHRFRRTLATNLLRKGMTIEEVSQILGHEKLDTTMIYCNINQDAVKNEYMRIMCA
jgi:site-specific recombinase XerD